MCACQRSLYPSKEPKRRSSCFELPADLKNVVHDEGNDVMNRCVLARLGGCTAPLLFFLEAMNDDIPIRGNKSATAMTT